MKYRETLRSAPGERRVPRIDSRIRQCLVKAGREGSAANEFSGPGDLLDSDCLKGETQKQAVYQIQQQHLAIRAQLASRVQMSESVHASDNLTTAQTHEGCPNPVDVNSQDCPSLIDVKGLGRPKEFSHKEEDFQPWAKKMQAFFAAEIKESEMMLEWAADQTTETTTTLIDLEFFPTDVNEGRGVQNLEFILQQMYTMLVDLTSGEANDMVDNSRKNPLEAWRRLQERYDPTAGGRKRNILRTIISPERCSLQELQTGSSKTGL